MAQNWLVTGSSRGLGREVVEHALQQGDNVLATARNVERLGTLKTSYPGKLKIFQLDVTNPTEAAGAVSAAIAEFGRLDVLVNNAGYGHIAPFEQTSDADFRAQVEANLFGVVNLIRAALPSMRMQRGGHIINVSSIGGRVATPGLSAYQAAKWAVSGLTEALAQEATPFGVKVISIEPGGMKTNWGATANSSSLQPLSEYMPTVGNFLKLMERFVGNELGDPVKVAEVIFDLTRQERLPAHLILGSDALQVYALADARRRQEVCEWTTISRSVDVSVDTPSYLEGLQSS